MQAISGSEESNKNHIFKLHKVIIVKTNPPEGSLEIFSIEILGLLP